MVNLMSQSSLHLGVVLVSITAISYKKDSTMAMLWAAQDRGYTLHYMEQEDLFLNAGQAYAQMRPLTVHRDPEHWFDLGEADARPLAEREGVLIVNPTQALLTCNEKLFAQQFPQCCAPTLVSGRDDVLRAFHAEHGDVIFKPLDGMGGSGIFHIAPDGRNIGAVIEQLTLGGTRQVMAQRYLPAIKEGDTRILLIDGEPVPYGLARIPSAGETRGNLAAGGRGVSRELTDRDRWLIEQVQPTVRKLGLLFVGLDVIGDYITEINVTSPTCIREIDDQRGTRIAEQLLDAVARRLSAMR